MRKYLKKSGLAAVILVTVAAIAFLPRYAAQWIVAGAIAAWGITNLVIYFLNRQKHLPRKQVRFSPPVRTGNSVQKRIPTDFRYAVMQLSHRVTDKLHSAFPDGTWRWADEPTAKLFMDGGRARILTVNTEDYNEADVILDSFGRIDIKMLKTDRVSDLIKAKAEDAETDYTVDVKMWYEQRGQQVLTNLITDLNARGAKTICIQEDGSITTDQDEQIGLLQAFPTKNLWKKLIEIFESEGLKAVEDEHSIQLGW